MKYNTLHQKVNSFVLRRRDAVVSRAVRKKITDLQRVLNFRKIRIFDRFLYLSNVEIWGVKKSTPLLFDVETPLFREQLGKKSLTFREFWIFEKYAFLTVFSFFQMLKFGLKKRCHVVSIAQRLKFWLKKAKKGVFSKVKIWAKKGQKFGLN